MRALAMASWLPQPELSTGTRAGVPLPESPVVVEARPCAKATPPNLDQIPLAPPAMTCAEPVPAAGGGMLAAVVELGKPRITRLVALTALGGLALGLVGRPWTSAGVALAAVGCAAGTALCSGGANALNQCLEVERDARMHRTRHRPIPSGRLTRRMATIAGLAMLVVGLAILWPTCGPAAALIAALTAAVYLFAYTPLKPRSVLNTWVGTIPGALPPLIGWCAAAYASALAAGHAAPARASFESLREPGGWALFALMAVWQIPHFLALAWLYREDYARGGYRMLTVIDPDGRATVTQIIVWAALLVPASLAPWLAMPERVGVVYPIVAGLTSVWYLIETVRLAGDRSSARARRVFLVSVLHLPVLVIALIGATAGNMVVATSGSVP